MRFLYKISGRHAFIYEFYELQYTFMMIKVDTLYELGLISKNNKLICFELLKMSTYRPPPKVLTFVRRNKVVVLERVTGYSYKIKKSAIFRK